jgi:hypothetical protein
VWTDPSGEDHYTDDPSIVPTAARKSLRRLDEEGSSLSVVETEDAPADPEADAAARSQLLVEQSDRRKLEILRAELLAALGSLQRRISDADREARKYGDGGRIGAAEAAEKARELARVLRAQLAGKERELQALLERLESAAD